MEYRFAPAADHRDLDAVLVSAPGRPTLPVRLTLELFGRALSYLDGGPVTVWDPCCGAGATLAVLGLRRGFVLSGLVGTDVDPGPLDLARRNLALLAPGGLDARASELDELARRHGKPGYSDAADGARRLAERRTAERRATDRHAADRHAADRRVTRAGDTPPEPPSTVPTIVSVADAADVSATRPLVARHRPRVVLADLPHGRQTEWVGENPAPDLVGALSAVLDPGAVLALVGRGRKLDLPPGTRALERLRVGHRAAALVRVADVRAEAR